MDNNTKGIIVVDESQPTQELYQYVFDIKEEISNEMSNTHATNTRNLKSPSVNKQQSTSKRTSNLAKTPEMKTGCADCDKVT